MNISEVRKSIKAKLDAGLISTEESTRFNRRLSQIQARSDIHWSQKKRLYGVYS